MTESAVIVALYARVSSDDQREAQTIQTQLAYARGRAKLEGWTLREFMASDLALDLRDRGDGPVWEELERIYAERFG